MLEKNSKIVIDSKKASLVKCGNCGSMQGLENGSCSECHTKLSKLRNGSSIGMPYQPAPKGQTEKFPHNRIN